MGRFLRTGAPLGPRAAARLKRSGRGCTTKFMSQAGLGILKRGMPNRSLDWLSQAQRDLEQAEDSRRAGRHEWACFAAQQAGEKAVNALHLSLLQQYHAGIR